MSITPFDKLRAGSGLTQALSDGTNTYISGVDRIAQTGGAGTEYFLGDALGSVRQLADVPKGDAISGAVVLAQAYDPYGVTANASGAAQTSYGFTAEYTSAAAGLIYLRARYYSGDTGRFLTRDTWEGRELKPITRNFWLYANANPVLYTDPGGHGSLQGDTWKSGLTFDQFEQYYGIDFNGDWPWMAKYAVYDAVESVGTRLSTVPALAGKSSYEAFRLVYHHGVSFVWDKRCSGCHPKWCQDNDKWEDPVYGEELDKNGKRKVIDDKGNRDSRGNVYDCKPKGGVTLGRSEIDFATLFLNSGDTEWYPNDQSYYKARNNVVHELGHVFNLLAGGLPVMAVEAAYDVGHAESHGMKDYHRQNWPKRTDSHYQDNYGFASKCDQLIWQMHFIGDSSDANIYSEEFADMYLGWVFNRWEMNGEEMAPAGTTRSEWMNQYMPGWVQMIVGGQ
jgi:RHS repeat-associated protein